MDEAMTDRQAVLKALARYADAEGHDQAAALVYGAIREAASKDGDPALRQAVDELRPHLNKAGRILAGEILAAIGRLPGWE